MAIEIVDFPIKNGNFPVRYVNVHQRVPLFFNDQRLPPLQDIPDLEDSCTSTDGNALKDRRHGAWPCETVPLGAFLPCDVSGQIIIIH